MGTEWRDCVVTLIDLVGVRRQARNSSSVLMRRLPGVVRQALDAGLSSVDHAYVWNDSVLTVAFLDGNRHEAIMRDLDCLKRSVDQVTPSYAVSVQGQVFPQHLAGAGHDECRVTAIGASSWALANCFKIEQALKGHRKAWYVDGRIASRVAHLRRGQHHPVELLPTGKARQVYVYDGYLWE